MLLLRSINCIFATMRIIIIDDEANGREMLKSLLEREFENITIIAEASSAFEARVLINEHKPDLIFLDVNMPMLNGFDLLQSFNNKSFYTIIISAYNNYATEALKQGAIGYILKPIISEELHECVKNVQRLIDSKKSQEIETNKSNAQRVVVMSTHKGTDIIPFDDILYVFAQVNYIDVYLASGSKNNYAKTLKAFYENLPKDIFYRPHKSFVINTKFITGYDKISRNIILNNTVKIPVARDKRAEIQKWLSKI